MNWTETIDVAIRAYGESKTNRSLLLPLDCCENRNRRRHSHRARARLRLSARMAQFVLLLWHSCTTSIRTAATPATPACAGFRLNGIFSRSPHPPRPRSTAAPPSSLCHHQSEPRVFATFERSTRNPPRARLQVQYRGKRHVSGRTSIVRPRAKSCSSSVESGWAHRKNRN